MIEYPFYEVLEMLKHSLQHPEADIRAASAGVLYLLYD